MRKVGKRWQSGVSIDASGDALKEGARFNESLQALPTGHSTFIPKGVYFFKTLAEADAHREECLAKGMARRAKKA